MLFRILSAVLQKLVVGLGYFGYYQDINYAIACNDSKKHLLKAHTFIKIGMHF